VVGSAVFGGMYFGLVILLHGGYAPVRQILRFLQDMVPCARKTPAPAAARELVEETPVP
jgi:hypothetical protein